MRPPGPPPPPERPMPCGACGRTHPYEYCEDAEPKPRYATEILPGLRLVVEVSGNIVLQTRQYSSHTVTNVQRFIDELGIARTIAAASADEEERLASADAGSVLRRCVRCLRRGPYRVYMDNDCLRAICQRCGTHIDIGHSPAGYDPEETKRNCSGCGEVFTHRNPFRSICTDCEDIP